VYSAKQRITRSLALTSAPYCRSSSTACTLRCICSSYTRARLRGLEATGESMGQKQKAWDKSMRRELEPGESIGCGESLSQAPRRVPRPLLSRTRNNLQIRREATDRKRNNRQRRLSTKRVIFPDASSGAFPQRLISLTLRPGRLNVLRNG
jgi:hypothetical protein